RKFPPVDKPSVPGKICHGLLGIPRHVKEIRNPGHPKSVLEEHHIVRVILYLQHWSKRHQPPAFCNRTQKRLPRSGSDSTPAVPPIRSTALRTMASPIPVPS